MIDAERTQLTPSGRLLTVIIPFTDDGRYVAQLLSYWEEMPLNAASVKEIEFVLIDQSPTNGPGQQLRSSLANIGYQVQLVRQYPATGPGSGRQRGLEMVTTDFVCFIDVDDRPELSVFVDAARLALRKSLDVVAVGYRVESPGRPTEYGEPPRDSHFWRDLLIRRAGIWRFVFRNQMLRDENVSFPTWDYAEDLAFLLDCARASSRTGYLNKVGYHYALHRGGLSGRRPDSLQVRRAIQWLRKRISESRNNDLKFVISLWVSRISILGGWTTSRHAVPVLHHLLRHPLIVARLTVLKLR